MLLFLNLVVDYLLIAVAGSVLKKRPSVWRTVLGAGAGAISSLYIFLPPKSIFFEMLFKVFVCFIMSLCSFGFGCLKAFLRSMGVLVAVSCTYGGIMLAVWYLFKPKGMIINNSVVYFNISPLSLVCFSVVFYICFTVFSRMLSQNSEYAEKCQVEISANYNTTSFCAIVDTGNSIEDVFGKSEVIIADKSQVENLFGSLDKQNNILRGRYRVLPCGTVSGDGILEGYRCDSATVTTNSKTVTLKKPIIAVSKLPIRDGYFGIVNPKTIN